MQPRPPTLFHHMLLPVIVKCRSVPKGVFLPKALILKLAVASHFDLYLVE